MMIVVEERLAEVFAQLPPIGGVACKYHFGDGIEANKFIKGANHDVYPLVYQTSNNWTGMVVPEIEVETDLVLLLCVQNLNQDMYNSERWATSYRNVLLPLFENVDKALQRSGIISSDYRYSVRNYPNYSERESKENNKFIDIVDAIEVSLRVTISANCVQTINFNF